MTRGPSQGLAARENDNDDVRWALQAAAAQLKQGGAADAIVWIKRAADAADAAGLSHRGDELRGEARRMAQAMWDLGGAASEPPEEVLDEDDLEIEIEVEAGSAPPRPPLQPPPGARQPPPPPRHVSPSGRPLEPDRPSLRLKQRVSVGPSGLPSHGPPPLPASQFPSAAPAAPAPPGFSRPPVDRQSLAEAAPYRRAMPSAPQLEVEELDAESLGFDLGELHSRPPPSGGPASQNGFSSHPPSSTAERARIAARPSFNDRLSSVDIEPLSVDAVIPEVGGAQFDSLRPVPVSSLPPAPESVRRALTLIDDEELEGEEEERVTRDLVSLAPGPAGPSSAPPVSHASAVPSGPPIGYQRAAASVPPISYAPSSPSAPPSYAPAGRSAPPSYAPAGPSAPPISYAPAGPSAPPISHAPAGPSAPPISYAPAGPSAPPIRYAPAGSSAPPSYAAVRPSAPPTNDAPAASQPAPTHPAGSARPAAPASYAPPSGSSPSPFERGASSQPPAPTAEELGELTLEVADLGPPEAASEAPVSAGGLVADSSIDGIRLDEVQGFEDLPEEVQQKLAVSARVEVLQEGEEVAFFGAAVVTSGSVDILPAFSDDAGAVAHQADVVFTKGTLADSIELRVVAKVDDTHVAVWDPDQLEEALAECPWVSDELRFIADYFLAVCGAALGPLGERLDDSLRATVFRRLEVRALAPNEVLLHAGERIHSLFVVGGGRVELRREGTSPMELPAGGFVFPDKMMTAQNAPCDVQAGEHGALVLFAPRAIAHELMMSVPPLLEVLAG